MGYRTATNYELNAYRARLDVKLHNLIDEKESYRFLQNERGEKFMILCVQGNRIDNPNGNWKWNGWEIVGKYYRCGLYSMEVVQKTETGYRVTGLPLEHFAEDDNKDGANEAYKLMVRLVKENTEEELEKRANIKRYGEDYYEPIFKF